MAMETHVSLASSEPSVGVNDPTNSVSAAYVGVSVLIYVLLLFALAPKHNLLSRRKSSL
jgi:hypothetical protein